MTVNNYSSSYALGSADSEHELLNKLLVAGVTWLCGDWSHGHRA